ncbi:ralBP1-associated Eps domain-containing protein 2 [Spea bombifrons]|uniref:ralBP1-associated Eps domain-containing protein 2 n=1 Tax=Spea bombifrons TaxID=233779 RepID=UPI00234BD3C5|nr:ralBP1-associated Eps domain-containing protein 2 [Spea bombifrons]
MDTGSPGLPSPQVIGGLQLPLSENEQKYYSELFCLCQVEGSPTLAAGSSKVGELFKAAQLPADIIHQITELCGAKHVGFFGPTQFFISLKLIAAAQSGLPVRLESIQSELPLPRFFSMKSDEVKYGIQPENIEVPGAKHGTKEKGPTKCIEGEKQPIRLYYSLSAAAAAAYETRQSALLQQDGQLSLNYGNQPAPLQSSLSRSFSVEKEVQDSSSNYTDDPWRITEEQREYYTNQFKTLQPNLKSFISGSIARDFFTKSKLPISELSHIWDLSDVDCDGALILSEFCAAFHLIVARKNGFELPETLPHPLLSEILSSVSLKPTTDGVYEPYCGAGTVCQNWKELETVCEDPANSEPLILFDVETSNAELQASAATPDLNALTRDSANNDLQASKVNPALQIVQVDQKGFQTFKTTVHQDFCTPKTRPRSRSYSSTSIEATMKKVEDPPTPPPRPQKTHSRASSLDLNRIIQHSSPAARAGWIQAPPPALPPRPCVTQGERGTDNELHVQTNKPMPQTEESSSPAKKEILLNQPPAKPLRRKFHPESQVIENHDLSSASSVISSSASSVKSHPMVQKHPSKQKKAIQTAIRKNKEANAVLARLNSELQQQLKEVHQERIALENQLEQLRPVTVL